MAGLRDPRARSVAGSVANPDRPCRDTLRRAALAPDWLWGAEHQRDVAHYSALRLRHAARRRSRLCQLFSGRASLGRDGEPNQKRPSARRRLNRLQISAHWLYVLEFVVTLLSLLLAFRAPRVSLGIYSGTLRNLRRIARRPYLSALMVAALSLLLRFA